MSVEMMSWARTQFGLKPGTKIVLYVLADEASSDGLVYSGQARLPGCARSLSAMSGHT